MALSATKLICFICLLTLFSVQIHARESQFFSKIPSFNSNNNNNYVQVTPNNKDEQSLNKQVHQEPSFTPETQNQKTTTLNNQQEPTFIPETQNGYGLYGQENNQFPTTSAADVKYEPYASPTSTFEPYTTPTSTTTTTSSGVKYEPYTTPITSTATGTFEPYSTTPTTSYNKYDNNGFETDQQESFGDSKFQESEYSSSYQNNNNVDNQGMSDTRYLENGRYYYDVKNENNYNPNQYHQQQQQQNSRGYYNGNTYEYNNSMEEGYHNEENEFDELP